MPSRCRPVSLHRAGLARLITIFCGAFISLPAVRAQSDTCVGATPLAEGSYQGSTADFGKDGSSSCGSAARSPDAWFTYTPEDDGIVVISTCGSRFDTLLSVHTGCPGTPDNQVVCNDDVCNLGSRVGLLAEGGRTYYIRVAGFGGAKGEYTLDISHEEDSGSAPPDLVVSDLARLTQVALEDGRVALSTESTICNIGDTPVDWYHNPDPRHPYLVFNAYRLLDGRIEQIGSSWVKHGFSASQNEACGSRCVPFSAGTTLGPGCADIYSVLVNASQTHMGPRSEVDPWTGEFIFEGSHVERSGGHAHGALDHRLHVGEEEIDAGLNPGAAYALELVVLSHDDADHENSIGWKPFTVDGKSNGRWRFSFSGGVRSGPALDAWSGARRTRIPAAPATDGRSYLAARADRNPGGSWRYRYALYNLDMHRGVRSFSVPVAEGARVSNVEFHMPSSGEERFHDEPWTVSRASAAVTWSTPPEGSLSGSNPLLWGTLATFAFDADRAPGESQATVVPFRPGAPASHSGTTVTATGAAAASAPFRRGDADTNGKVELTDIIFLLNHLFVGLGTIECFDAADMNDSGTLDFSDGIFGLNWLFRGGNQPLPPGPMSCGEDPTADQDPRGAGCVYECGG